MSVPGASERLLAGADAPVTPVVAFGLPVVTPSTALALDHAARARRAASRAAAPKP